MPTIELTTREGENRIIDAPARGSMMEALRNAGVAEVLALCGGCASCGTCHVYIDGDWLDRIPLMQEEEEEMLSLAASRTPQSRLSCQIGLTDALDGIKVTVAPDH